MTNSKAGAEKAVGTQYQAGMGSMSFYQLNRVGLGQHLPKRPLRVPGSKGSDVNDSINRALPSL